MTTPTAPQMRRLLGDLAPIVLDGPGLPRTPGVHRLVLHTPAGEPIRAVFGLPHEPGPHSAVVYAHAHGNRYDIGIDELSEGRPALSAPYGPDLLAQGHAFLAIEMPCFGSRAALSESAAAKQHLWQGTTLFGQMLAEQAATLDLLAAHPAVDPARIGVMGISMGGTLAWWLAALEPRLRCAVSMCCFADLGTLIDTGAHDGHGIYMMVPGLTRAARSGQIAGLGAHVAQLHCVGLQDWSTPAPAFDLARADLGAACQQSGARPPQFYVEPDLDHRETPAMRAAVLAFLETELSLYPG